MLYHQCFYNWKTQELLVFTINPSCIPLPSFPLPQPSLSNTLSLYHSRYSVLSLTFLQLSSAPPKHHGKNLSFFTKLYTFQHLFYFPISPCIGRRLQTAYTLCAPVSFRQVTCLWNSTNICLKSVCMTTWEAFHFKGRARYNNDLVVRGERQFDSKMVVTPRVTP